MSEEPMKAARAARTLVDSFDEKVLYAKWSQIARERHQKVAWDGSDYSPQGKDGDVEGLKHYRAPLLALGELVPTGCLGGLGGVWPPQTDA